MVAASVVSGALEIILESFWEKLTGKPSTRAASLTACLALRTEYVMTCVTWSAP